jgi:hypothetical protein
MMQKGGLLWSSFLACLIFESISGPCRVEHPMPPSLPAHITLSNFRCSHYNGLVISDEGKSFVTSTPGALWDQMIQAGAGIIVANPNSGPGSQSDPMYATYIAKARNVPIDVRKHCYFKPFCNFLLILTSYKMTKALHLGLTFRI